MKKILAFFSLAFVLGAVSCTNESKKTDEVTIDKKTVDGTPVTVTKEVDKGTVVVPIPPPPPKPPTPGQVIRSLPKPPLPPPPPRPPLPKRKGG
jgi:hypothetical protein